MQSTNNHSKEENEYSVEYWRNKFKEVRPQLAKNWHQQLATFDASLDSLKGANDMRAVAHGRASLVVTQRIVNIAEQLLARPRKRRTQKTLQERLRIGF